MSNVIGDKSAHCTNTLATCHSLCECVCCCINICNTFCNRSKWHSDIWLHWNLNAQTHNLRPIETGRRRRRLRLRLLLKYIRQAQGGWGAGGKRHVLTMFITVKYLHCRHKCNFMVCHFQPSCSQRTSASSACPGCPLLSSLPPTRRIFVILRAQHLRVDFDIPFAPDAALNVAILNRRQSEMGLQLGQMISKLQERHLDFSYFLEQKFIAAFSM